MFANFHINTIYFIHVITLLNAKAMVDTKDSSQEPSFEVEIQVGML